MNSELSYHVINVLVELENISKLHLFQDQEPCSPCPRLFPAMRSFLPHRDTVQSICAQAKTHKACTSSKK